MRGWFDAFRTGGGPTLYEFERTAATHDNIIVGLYSTFGALFLAFLIIIPGFRRNKIPTFLLLTGSMYVLATIVICQFSSYWHVSSSTLLASYKYGSSLRLPGRIGVNIGLASFNVTLQLDEVDLLLQDSLQRGYPAAILTVAEAIALDAGSFAWGRSYREAGYYCSIMLWSALASWLVMNLLFCLVPRYSGCCALLTGGLCFLSDAIYAQLLPAPPLVVHFEDGVLVFGFGWNFWMIISAGFVCLLFGVGIIIADLFFPQLISDVHASWHHSFSQSQICSAPLLYATASSGSKISSSYSTSPHCQIPIDRVLRIDQFRSPPIRRSSQWTPRESPAESRIDLSGQVEVTVKEEEILEEIDRATDLPRRTPQVGRKSGGNTSEPTLPSSETVIRDGLGYVNPVMWDINVQEHFEDRQAVFSTQSSTSSASNESTGGIVEDTRL